MKEQDIQEKISLEEAVEIIKKLYEDLCTNNEKKMLTKAVNIKNFRKAIFTILPYVDIDKPENKKPEAKPESEPSTEDHEFFGILRNRIHSTSNTNFHFNQLDWTVKVWIVAMCDLIEAEFKNLVCKKKDIKFF